ncbi:MAG: efflux RND transporter permease subunit [Pseudomonadota bacterium]
MLLSDVSVKRPIFAMVISLMLIAFGTISFTRLPLRELPDIDSPIVDIETTYEGASAAVVETRITQPIESRISGIEGIKTMSSTSRDGRSNITVEFNLSRDIDNAANDIRDRVAVVLNNLPEEAEPPEIAKVDADTRPILWLNLASPVLDILQLSDYAERNIVDRLSVVDGVARVIIGGRQRYAMRIFLDRNAMAARNITVTDIEASLRRENVELPAGRLESLTRDLTVRTEREYASADDFRLLKIGEGETGQPILLAEVARVELASERDKSSFRGNGVPMIGLGVVRQSTANTLDVARAIQAEAERIRETLPESMSLLDSYDSSIFIDSAIQEVYRTLGVAIALVVVVLYLFLGSFRAVLVPAVTVPVCIVATFLILAAFGLTINLLTLLALVLSIGLVVDDAIVVLENISRRVEEGEPPLLAAYRGARQVGFAVIATTLVLIGVFVPIAFLQGNIGRLFAELAITLAAAVAFSSLVALTLTPMMCSKILKNNERKPRLSRWVDAGFRRVQGGYAKSLSFCFAHKPAIILMFLSAFVIIAGLLRNVPTELVPFEDRGSFFVAVRGPEGAGFEYMTEEMRKVEANLLPLIEEGQAERVLVRNSGGSNRGFAIVLLKQWDERDRGAQDILNQVRRGLGTNVPGVFAFPIMRSPLGGGGDSTPLQFVIGGASYDDLARYKEIVEREASKNPGLLNLETDYQQTQPQLSVEIDRNRAADLGVSIQTIGQTLETMLGGRRVTTFVDRGEEYDVIVRASDQDRQSPSDLAGIFVRSAQSQQLIPLSNLVKLTEMAGSGELRRFNRIRALTVSANLADGYPLGEAIEFMETLVREYIPDAASVDYKGESREYKEAGGAVYFTFVMALIVVFLILAGQFESFIHPFVIMLTVPLAVAGGLFGLFVAGGSLNIYSQIGMVMLIGLAAKNGILIVEFANQLRDEGQEIRDALVEACQIRLRPIIMTGLSTAIGAVPLIVASGAGAGSRQTIGVVIFAGVLVATIFTLFIVPVFYDSVARFTRSPGFVAKQLEVAARKNGSISNEPAE